MYPVFQCIDIREHEGVHPDIIDILDRLFSGKYLWITGNILVADVEFSPNNTMKTPPSAFLKEPKPLLEISFFPMNWE